MRRTVASFGLVKVVQRMLGHASAAMTLDVYADLFDDELTGVAEKFDESVGKMRARRGDAAL
jgi:integrase